MELSQEFVDGLELDTAALVRGIAEKTGAGTAQAAAVVSLLDEGCTVPFIARYRKERTGGLDEVQVRDVAHLFSSGKNLETRRLEIVRSLFSRGKLDAPLYENIRRAAGLAELEDIYAPYKRSKKTRGMLALEKGLGPLAEAVRELEDAALLEKAKEFLLPDGGGPVDGGVSPVLTVEDALQGAADIVAEQAAQDSENRAAVKAFCLESGRITAKASGTPGKGDEEAKKTSVYQMYWDFSGPLSRLRPHQVLAINRGEREGVLDVAIDIDLDAAVPLLRDRGVTHNAWHRAALEDSLRRLLAPAVLREIRGDQGEAADDHGISVFSENLKNLLMQQPIRGTRVLGIDPGIRTGTKCAFLDETGKYLGHAVVYSHRAEEAKKTLLEGIRRYGVQLAAVGNGTGTREAQEIVAQTISENSLDVLFTVVDEDGASVYSAGDIAREEFPSLDLTIRGAVSIGRRLQDPLAELVKIDPKSIGVGLYQHDLNQRKLSGSLDETVSSVVNSVGVNLNTASVSLLKYVSGINASLAKKIVNYRDEKGKISARGELSSIPGMGPKSYEQCAGFLKIPESAEPLDNTWVHPENYAVAREIRERTGAGEAGTAPLPPGAAAALREKYGVGDVTIGDIIEELKKPNRDPRDGCPRPVMRKDVVNFEDLSVGMAITGKIKNVVDFGAFVDLGIKETALVHVSELSDRFVKDPLDIVKAGDVLEFRIINLDRERRRIGLSRKSTPGPQGGLPLRQDRAGGAGEAPAPLADGKAGGGKAKVTAKSPAAGNGGLSARSAGPDSGGDGTMYSPFAAAFRKREERKLPPGKGEKN